MPTDIRCFVIAAENYPSAKGLSNNLQGTSLAAFDFIEWMLKVQGIAPENIWVCADPELSVTGVQRYGTTRSEVRKAIISLTAKARNVTRQLFVFISGHGFAFKSSAATAPADMFVCSEYVDLATGGDACVDIAELQKYLAYWIGGLDHFYFVDCCRNIIDQTYISPVTLALALEGADVRKPFVYTLYSTGSGAQAFTTSGFAKYLLEALNGKGRAKGWTVDNQHMQVLFDLVKKYVKQKVANQQVEAKPADGDGIIFELPGIPVYECAVSVVNAGSDDVFNIQLMLRGQPYGLPVRFQGSSGKISAQPELYSLKVNHPTLVVVQVKPPAAGPVDLFDPSEAEFELQHAQPEPRPPEPIPPEPITLSDLSIVAPSHTTIELTNLNSNQTAAIPGGTLIQKVEPGFYRLRVLEDNVPIREQSFSIDLGESKSEDFLQIPKTLARESISKAIGSSLEQGVVDFSERLGPMSNSDMGLWLSILGASKIIDRPDTFSKLSQIPTAGFDDIPPGNSAIFLLAAFESHGEPVQVGIHDGANLDWRTAEGVTAVPGVQQLKIHIPNPGPGLLSIAIGKHPTSTFVVHTVPNRVTLITLSQERTDEIAVDEQGQELRHVRRYQYLLPLSRLAQYNDWELSSLTEGHTNLRSIRAMFTIQQRFCAQRAVVVPGTEVETLWQDSMWGKWLDPMMSVIMCYELIRQGKGREMSGQIRVVANNLSRYFGMPDSEAILTMIRDRYVVPKTPPLFVDGIIPYSKESDLLPFPAAKIDYRSPWTTWRAVVTLTDSKITGTAGGSKPAARRRTASAG